MPRIRALQAKNPPLLESPPRHPEDAHLPLFDVCVWRHNGMMHNYPQINVPLVIAMLEFCNVVMRARSGSKQYRSICHATIQMASETPDDGAVVVEWQRGFGCVIGTVENETSIRDAMARLSEDRMCGDCDCPDDRCLKVEAENEDHERGRL